MASNDRPQLALALRKRDIETAFSVSNTSQQKLERQGGFAGSRTPFDQINAIRVEAAAEDVIEPGAAARNCLGPGICRRCGFGHSVPLANVRSVRLVRTARLNLILKSEAPQMPCPRPSGDRTRVGNRAPSGRRRSKRSRRAPIAISRSPPRPFRGSLSPLPGLPNVAFAHLITDKSCTHQQMFDRIFANTHYATVRLSSFPANAWANAVASRSFSKSTRQIFAPGICLKPMTWNFM